MSRAFTWFAVYAFVVLAALALYDALDARLRAWWQSYLAARLAPLLEAERSRHAEELAEARRQHRDAQLWLMETHRMELARMEKRQQQRVDEAVIDAMMNVAPHPKLRAS